MAASNLFLDPRYAALMATARAMLAQRAVAAPQGCELAAARRLEQVLRFARSRFVSLADETPRYSGELKAAVEA
jgi:hypothetical protein